ncbi:MAG: RsmB/NOP family class I SAM-dependent RNA methyltransferase [Alphaproteobacteria bacterium]|nr:RsmB/NOP family class I SAM-dependent RNA methyltransferase [Alphaproteobacteria bacterium]
MTPGARLAAAIELIDDIAGGDAPADRRIDAYMRKRRFIGSKDRAAVTERVYGLLRRRARLDWWIERSGLDAKTRTRLIADLVATDKLGRTEIGQMMTGQRYDPPPPSPAELRLIARLGAARAQIDHADMPPSVQGDCPDWLWPRLEALYGAAAVTELKALNEPASFDLRVNTLKATRDEVLADLKPLGLGARPTALSPHGVRLAQRWPVDRIPAFKEGKVEVQDEGSQLVAMLADVEPGMRVVDFCAGAGGKTLAMAARMQNRGHIVACDINAKRIERAVLRLRRAGVQNVERRTLSTERDPWIKRHARKFDRVFVDAPCTGTGTWRRNPDAKWWLKPGHIDELVTLQSRILESAARLARPDGRVIYVTCSLLPEENENQVAAFLAAHDDFILVPVPSLWGKAVGGACPVATDMLRLTPARHGTDGFFAAILQRKPS